MRIIDRYITSEFLKVFAICVAGFVLVLLLLELTDKIKDYVEHNPPGWVMIQYFLVKIPGFLFFAIPLGILMAGMLSLLLMARHSEVIAMQANGVDALSVARPVLLIGVAGSALMLLANESVIPWSNRYSERILRDEIQGKADTTVVKSDGIWMRSANAIVHVRKFDKHAQTLDRVSIVRWDRHYDFSERIFAEKAKWWKDHWILYGVNRTVRSDDGGFHVESVPSLAARLDQAPEEFGRAESVTKEMTLAQLSALIDKMEEEGEIPTRYLVDWHDKIAFPWACLIMSALSVPFAVRVNPRGGGVALGLALSLVVAFLYWITHTVFVALGHGGSLPPIAAAWGANIVFGLTATMLLLHADT